MNMDRLTPLDSGTWMGFDDDSELEFSDNEHLDVFNEYEDNKLTDVEEKKILVSKNDEKDTKGVKNTKQVPTKEKVVEFYQDSRDEKDIEWVSRNIRGEEEVSKTRTALSCACCFSLVCFESKNLSKKHTNHFTTNRLVDCKVDNTVTLKSEKIGVNCNPIVCGNCGCQIGVTNIEGNKSYSLFEVLPSIM
eukprot:TRINITY_DN1496_c0_g1_i1.p1 TRINITY_DN1496_c0_g1~~TRINITY_DN1496_c0_g1_i1.p1  ORF type:complete len:191 (+),score=35.61 TRINITY_DN1496_c0_g1_i1:25-597(+)